MAKLREREKAIALRKEKQMSYSQIKKILRVSKGTLSLWLRRYPLPEERIRELQKSEAVIEKIRNTKRLKREKRLGETYEKQKKKILPLNKRELFIAGLLLYWGEGTKSRMDSLEISNSDPAVIKFFIHWIARILSVPRNRIRIQLHLYNDMDIAKETTYWSSTLKIPKEQFNKPYIKETSSKRINHKGSFGHGTCQIRAGNTPLAEKIFMSIKAIRDQYS